MKTGFKEPNAVKNQHPKDSPEKDYKYWECKQPQYDNRSSCPVNVGTHYGVGINQPVGHTGNPKQRVACLPYGRPNTLEVDEAG